jgi:hypothetical protein
VGAGSCGSNGDITGGNNPFGIKCTIDNSNVGGVPGGIGQDPGNGAGVNTGIEIRIPLAQIGNPAGPVRVCAFIFSDGYDFVSNQFLGGIGGGDNLGEPRTIVLSAVTGDQWFNVPGGASAETLAPTAETINLGQGISGNLASWAADDNNARRIKKFFVPTLTSPFVRVNLDYTTTKANPTAIDFKVKAKMVDAGSFAIRLYLQNKVTTAFDQVLGNTGINLGYQTYTGSATGTVGNYRSGAGVITGRIELQQTGPSTQLLPSADFEYGNMVVTG